MSLSGVGASGLGRSCVSGADHLAEISRKKARLEAIASVMGAVDGGKASMALDLLDEYDGDPLHAYFAAEARGDTGHAELIAKECREAGLW